MNTQVNLDLEKIRLLPNFVEMEQQTFTDGVLSKKHKELIAIGISLINSCEFLPGMAYQTGPGCRRNAGRNHRSFGSGFRNGNWTNDGYEFICNETLKHHLGEDI